VSVCLTATLVYCGQTVGWIKTKLGTEVGLGPGHILLYGDPAPLQKKRHSGPHTFGPCLLWTNGWIDQGATSYGGRPRFWPHCARWEPSSPQRGTAPNFRPMSVVAKRSPILDTAEHLMKKFSSAMKRVLRVESQHSPCAIFR